MKLTIKRTEFLSMLTYASKAIPTKSAENQFYNFLINVTDEDVSIIASDGNTSVRVAQPKTDANGNDIIINSEPGCIQTRAKILLEMINAIGGDIVTLNLVDTNLLDISNERTVYNLNTLPGEDYPDIDFNIEDQENCGFKVSLTDLKTLFDTTSYAVATQGTKDMYYGINVCAKNGKLFFRASDRHRAASFAIPEPDQQTNFSFTCPVIALGLITSIPEAGDCTIYYDEQKALFKTDKVTLSSRLFVGDFKEIEGMVPPNRPYRVSMNTSDFLSAINRAKIIIGNDEKSRLKLTLHKNGEAVIFGKSMSNGTSSEAINNAKIELPDDMDIFPLYFNADQVVEAVRALKSEQVAIEIGLNSVFMVKNDNPDSIHLIVAVKGN